ncbi:hypothetical protein EVAR_24733_1 [Eumeta japonica]|uniref:Uncharacterized protein n=1 Tax=Eumeta variegata TaxID=151549 RepID=A0A4C1VDX1_EUMVA|nr:hypothetical protein EVAR_24733_1 [Eumeta japonica]
MREPAAASVARPRTVVGYRQISVAIVGRRSSLVNFAPYSITYSNLFVDASPSRFMFSCPRRAAPSRAGAYSGKAASRKQKNFSSGPRARTAPPATRFTAILGSNRGNYHMPYYTELRTKVTHYPIGTCARIGLYDKTRINVHATPTGEVLRNVYLNRGVTQTLLRPEKAFELFSSNFLLTEETKARLFSGAVEDCWPRHVSAAGRAYRSTLCGLSSAPIASLRTGPHLRADSGTGTSPCLPRSAPI